MKYSHEQLLICFLDWDEGNSSARLYERSRIKALADEREMVQKKTFTKWVGSAQHDFADLASLPLPHDNLKMILPSYKGHSYSLKFLLSNLFESILPMIIGKSDASKNSHMWFFSSGSVGKMSYDSVT